MLDRFGQLRPTVLNGFMVHCFNYARNHPFAMNGPESRFFIKTSSGSANLILQHSEILPLTFSLNFEFESTWVRVVKGFLADIARKLAQSMVWNRLVWSKGF
jgi:hypothetical protein